MHFHLPPAVWVVSSSSKFNWVVFVGGALKQGLKGNSKVTII